MHSGQMPWSAVGGTGFPQCGHVCSAVITSVPPFTTESFAKGYRKAMLKAEG
jgi:hypothetical protein